MTIITPMLPKLFDSPGRMRGRWIGRVAIVGALVLPLLADPHPPAVLGQATSGCELRLARSYPSIEGPWVARWDDEVDVIVDLTVDCRDADRAPRSIEVLERLPPGMAFIASDNVPPTTITVDGPLWRINLDEDPFSPRVLDTSLDYSLRVRPTGLPVEPNGEMRVRWPTDVRAVFSAQDVTVLPVTRQMDLPVQLVRPEGGCIINTTRSYDPKPVRAGGEVTVTLTAVLENCRRSPPRQVGMIALQPITNSLALTRTVSIVLAFLERLTPAQGEMGVLVNRFDGVDVAGPSIHAEDVLPLVRAMTPEPRGGDARRALRSALDRVPDAPLHRGVVVYIAHAGAPPANEALVRDVLDDAAARDVDVVTICVGGGCDPAVPWHYELPDLRLLFHAVKRGGLMDAHNGEPLSLEAVDVTDHLPEGAEWLGSSGQTPAPMFGADGALQWRDLPLAQGQPLTIQYRMRAPPTAGERFVGDGHARPRYTSGAQRVLGDPLRLPRAPLLVQGPPEGPDPGPCIPQLSKAPWQPSVLLGDEVDIELRFVASCPDLLRDSDVLLALDVSGSMDEEKLADVKIAGRSLIETAASPRVHIGLLTFNERIRSRLPLAGDYRAGLDAISAMGFPIGQGSGTTDIGRALKEARLELQHRRADARAWVVLMSDGMSDSDAMSRAAAELKADGVTVITVCFGGPCPPQLAAAATEPRFHYEVFTAAALDQLFESLGLLFRELSVTQADFVDELPADMPLVRGSDQPTADVAPDARSLHWHFPAGDLPFRTLLTYRVTPQRKGTHPTNEHAAVQFVDELGRPGSAVFPLPAVTVFEREAHGPCVPVLAREPSRTVAVLDSLVTTTLTARLDCPARIPSLEIVLAIDHSDSMRAGGRMEAVKAAAAVFLDTLDPDAARVGLVAFNEGVSTELPLDADYQPVRSAIAALQPRGGTSITGALRAADRILAARRPESAAVILLLTDGREPRGAINAMLATATALKERGARIATVCAGACDPELAQVASDAGSAFDATDPDALRNLFVELARRFSTPLPRDIKVIDAYPRAMRMVLPGFAPPPSTFLDSQATWLVDSLPENGAAWRTTGRPQQTGPMRFQRFARLEYAYGFPPEVGWAYFPETVLDVITPTPTATFTAIPTFTASPTAIASSTSSPTWTTTPPGGLATGTPTATSQGPDPSDVPVPIFLPYAADGL